MFQNFKKGEKMKFIYGTSNKAKVEAMKKIIAENNISAEIITLREIGFDEDIDENGTTFEENSEIKARAIEKFCNKNNIKDKIIITDDAGLCIDKLNGEPGVYTARYAGKNPTQIENITKVLDNMKKYIKKEERTCTFVCVLTAILLNTGEKLVGRGECKGTIATEPGPLGGLTYSPIFIPEGFDVPMSKMPEAKYEKVHNHRNKAMKILVEQLKEKNIL